MKFNIKNFDLNLLAIFDALIVERKVSKVESGVEIHKRLICACNFSRVHQS